MSTADVSVVIPYYESQETILHALASVAAQTSPVRQVVVVDDGSGQPLTTDFVPHRLRQVLPLEIIRLDTNAGASSARNTGLAQAVSRYVAFLDADDVWFPEKIRLQTAFMEASGLDLSGHGYTPLNTGNHAATAFPGRSRTITRRHFLWGNPFFTPTVMVRRDTFKGFDPRFRRVDDYKAWFESVAARPARRLDAVLATGFKPAIGASGLTGSIPVMHESYRAVLRTLLEEGKLTPPEYCVAVGIEALKFPFRLLRTSCGTRARQRLS